VTHDAPETNLSDAAEPLREAVRQAKHEFDALAAKAIIDTLSGGGDRPARKCDNCSAPAVYQCTVQEAGRQYLCAACWRVYSRDGDARNGIKLIPEAGSQHSAPQGSQESSQNINPAAQSDGWSADAAAPTEADIACYKKAANEAQIVWGNTGSMREGDETGAAVVAAHRSQAVAAAVAKDTAELRAQLVTEAELRYNAQKDFNDFCSFMVCDPRFEPKSYNLGVKLASDQAKKNVAAEKDAEIARLKEENRALRAITEKDSWSGEMQDALDSIPRQFQRSDYWVNGIKRMAESHAARERELAQAREDSARLERVAQSFYMTPEALRAAADAARAKGGDAK